MPFPKNHVQFRQSFGSSPIIATIEDESTGVLKEVIKDCNEKLPDAENFEIANQIKAGVALQETNTKILSSENTPNIKDLTTAIQEIDKKKQTNNNKTQGEN